MAFAAFAQAEMEDILKRDAEDGEKLAAGITMAVEKGVLQANPPVEPLTRIDVLGKTADAVCQEIIKALGDAPSMGCVLVLQGLSGTGKGTTCSLLEQKLPRCTSWSNGNVRSKHQTRARSSCCDARPRGVRARTGPLRARTGHNAQRPRAWARGRCVARRVARQSSSSGTSSYTHDATAAASECT